MGDPTLSGAQGCGFSEVTLEMLLTHRGGCWEAGHGWEAGHVPGPHMVVAPTIPKRSL